jgi:phosphonate metabolism protein PhnN/1,5-bisphosphokinase (PRPP-forming)
MSGTAMLVLVVGPSGAGKDTLLTLARKALADDPRFRFVRRVITRPADAGGEDHETVSEAQFATRDFALSWAAHGLHYGISADIADDIARGVVVVANVSRSIIAQAAARFPVRVIEVTAPADLLAARLASRGREPPADIAERLARRVSLPGGIDAAVVVNDGMPEAGAAQLLAHLGRASQDSGRRAMPGERSIA